MFVEMPENLLMKLSQSIYEIIDRPGAPKAHKLLTISPNIDCSDPSVVLLAQLYTLPALNCRDWLPDLHIYVPSVPTVRP